jgi:LPS sulfotransferase NodH
MKSPRFLIIADNRTGSTAIQFALDRHPQLSVIDCEPFSWSWPLSHTDERQQEALKERNKVLNRVFGDGEYDFNSTLEHNFIPAFNCLWAQFNGFKLMRGYQVDFSNPVWTYIACQHDVKSIFLVRKNKLAQFVSDELARLTGVYHLVRWPPEINERDKSKLDAQEVTVDTGYLLSRIQEWTQTETYVENLLAGSSMLKVVYEDFAQNPQNELREMQRFLGVPQEQLNVCFNKSNTKTLEERVTNIKEVKRALGAVYGSLYQ